jgi:hypothetical protein
MSDYIDTTVRDIDSRLHELQEEVERLLAARAALIGDAKRGPGRPRGSANSNAPAVAGAPARKRAGSGRPPGRRGGGTRSSQALELVRSEPGITIPQIAEALEIEPNSHYRVMPRLLEEGVVTRDGLGYYPASGAAETAESNAAHAAAS